MGVLNGDSANNYAKNRMDLSSVIAIQDTAW